jgi:hypothetical protein
LPFRYFRRSSENFTSAEVTGLLSANFALGSSLNVHTLSFLLPDHEVASRGTSVWLSSDSPTRVS